MTCRAGRWGERGAQQEGRLIMQGHAGHVGIWDFSGVPWKLGQGSGMWCDPVMSRLMWLLCGYIGKGPLGFRD